MAEERWEFAIKQDGEEIVIELDCSGSPYGSSIEESEVLLQKTLEKLAEVPGATKISFLDKNITEYGWRETRMLKQLVQVLRTIKESSIVQSGALEKAEEGAEAIEEGGILAFTRITLAYLFKDPIGGFVDLRRTIVDVGKQEKTNPTNEVKKKMEVLRFIEKQMEELELIKVAQPYLAGHKVGDRSIYGMLFAHTSRPNFSLTKFYTNFPAGGEVIQEYDLPEGSKVKIFSIRNRARKFYHVTPLELSLSQEEYEAVDFVRRVLASHRPKNESLLDAQSLRHVFYELSRDLLEEFARRSQAKMAGEELDKLAKILVRSTAGYGVLESLLADPKIQDVNLNAPVGASPVRIYHEEFEECDSNIVPNLDEAKSWVSRLKLSSGRPLDQANPVLDTSIILQDTTARIAAVTRPLSPGGISFAIRKHREAPWTFPLLVKNKMMNSYAAGLLSFVIDGGRTMLIAGTRGAGKTSLLGAAMLEVLKKYRMITVEDTLELPVNYLASVGYDILPLKVRSPMSEASGEMSAESGIRTALRLGDSCLIVGEVRSNEARALYEAMRVGALANFVGGTIHGDTPYGVFDRVVNDLGVPPTSFKATDIVVIANTIRSADGMSRVRRITSITEVRKEWKSDPASEKGFVELMRYDGKKGELVPTEALLNGHSEILMKIGENVSEWMGDYNAILENIKLRAKVRDQLIKFSSVYNAPEALEGDFVSESNARLHLAMQESRKGGVIDSAAVFQTWSDWAKNALKGKE
ncbi:Type II/IV secretion system protein [Candidatus Gugararchaeum adminiculabundum]|nr:Type II/IV secretion system protein [Candidatus Gugararchaeum adminiculabundum]